MRIMIAGGFEDAKADTPEGKRMTEFARHLAEQIVNDGHCLRMGNISSMDALVIETAAEAAVKAGRDEAETVLSYVPAGQDMRCSRGTTNESAIADWDSMGGIRPNIPEPIEQADVLILLGGFGTESKTYTAANWARHIGTPILPIATFGLAAREIYNDLPSTNLKKICGVDVEDVRKLSRAAGSLDSKHKMETYAEAVVSLAERASMSREAFLIMSFNGQESLRDYRAAVEEICKISGFEALRADNHLGASEQIIDRIHEQIDSCGFVIADLTNERPNVYYEIGYARGLGKQVILTAQQGCEIHFDLQDFTVLRWSGTEQLKEIISPHVREIATSFGLSA